MELIWVLNYCLFLLVAIGGAWLTDQMVGLIAPGDACEGLLLWFTVGFLCLLFFIAIAYLRIAIVAMLHERWPAWFKGHSYLHAIGAGCLAFSIATPFIFLAGPKSSLIYGERVIVAEAIARSVPLQRAIERYWRERERLPQKLEDLDTRWKRDSGPSALASIELTATGGLKLGLISRRYPRLDGHSIELQPLLRPGEVSGWDCRKGDIPSVVRPANCRTESVCGVFGYAPPNSEAPL